MAPRKAIQPVVREKILFFMDTPKQGKNYTFPRNGCVKRSTMYYKSKLTLMELGIPYTPMDRGIFNPQISPTWRSEKYSGTNS
jgi:hypothetical protein